MASRSAKLLPDSNGGNPSDPRRSATIVALPELLTRERILLSAERLFAQHGFAGVSLRSIMAAADANTASAHYYFRSKEGLLKSIFDMRAAPMNAERHSLLDAYEHRPGTGKPAVRRLIAAFVGPAIRLRETLEGRSFDKISALCSVDPNSAVRAIVFEAFDEVGKRFSTSLRAACPHLSEAEYYWRLHCLFGSMMYVRALNGRVDYLVKPSAAPESAEFVLDQLARFVAAGMKAAGCDEKA